MAKLIDMGKEIWKNLDLPNLKPIYQVSDQGRIRSKARKKWNGQGFMILRDKILKPNINPTSGYLTVNLYDAENKGHTKVVHILTALFHIPNPLNLPIVGHKNNDRQDPRASNLYWTTYSDNMLHAVNSGAFKKLTGLKGKDSPRAKAVFQVAIAGEIIKRWDCISDAARELCLNVTLIIAVCKGRRNHHGGFKWRYAHPSSS